MIPIEWEGRRLLYQDQSDYVAIDLATGLEEVRVSAGNLNTIPWADARLGPDGSILLGAIGAEDPDRFVLRLIGPDGEETVLVDRPEAAHEVWATWLWDPGSGSIAIVDNGTIDILDPAGEGLASLPAPGVDCLVPRWWSPGNLLISCVDADYATTCSGRGWPGSGRQLWTVPTDGSEPTPITPSVEPVTDVCDHYEPEYIDALPFGGRLAVEAAGCCECGGDLWFAAPDGSMTPSRDLADLDDIRCSPAIVTVTGGDLMVTATLWDDEGWDAGVFRLTPDLSLERLLPGTTVGWALAARAYAVP